MEIRDRAVKEINNLTTNKLMALYEIILSMKNSKKILAKGKTSSAYLEVRESLKNLKGSLSDDIIMSREDRI